MNLHQFDRVVLTTTGSLLPGPYCNFGVGRILPFNDISVGLIFSPKLLMYSDCPYCKSRAPFSISWNLWGGLSVENETILLVLSLGNCLRMIWPGCTWQSSKGTRAPPGRNYVVQNENWINNQMMMSRRKRTSTQCRFGCWRRIPSCWKYFATVVFLPSWSNVIWSAPLGATPFITLLLFFVVAGTVTAKFERNFPNLIRSRSEFAR